MTDKSYFDVHSAYPQSMFQPLPAKKAAMINLSFLRQNAQKPEEVAEEVCAFISSAKKTLDIAMDDFRLSGKADEMVVSALKERARQGVMVRILFQQYTDPVTKHARATSIPVFDSSGHYQYKDLNDADGRKMRNKYMVADSATEDGKVWTGSTNFTNNAFSLQENTIVTLESPEACWYYSRDFEELWSSDKIFGTGVADRGEFEIVMPFLADVNDAGPGDEDGENSVGVQIAFCPSDESILNEIAEIILRAQDRVLVCTTVLGSAPILAALAASEVPKFGGVFDATEQHELMAQWKKGSAGHGQVWSSLGGLMRAKLFEAVSGRFVHKRSAPLDGGKSGLDTMSNRLLVVDDTVIVGSLALEESSLSNAENVLVIDDPDMADGVEEYVDELVAHYKER